MDRYKIDKVIGGGTFGTVYLGTNIKTGEVVAIKKIKKKFSTWDECMNLREIKSLRKLNHPNIVKLLEVFKVNDELYLIFEYLEQNLYQMYQQAKEKSKPPTEAQIRGIIYQTCAGLAHMHKHGFFHRDLKPENLLLQRDVVKICDFGLAREVRSVPPFTDYVATRWYRAPEIILKSINYNSPVDIFALGAIMAELYNMAPIFCGASEMDQLYKTFQLLGTPTTSQWPEGYRLAKLIGLNFPSFQPVPLASAIPTASADAISLLSDMLRFEAEKRPSAAQILAHPYFTGYVPPSMSQLPQVDMSNPNEHVNFSNGNQAMEENPMKWSAKRPTQQDIRQVEEPKRDPLPARKFNLDDSFDMESHLNDLLKEEPKRSKNPVRGHQGSTQAKQATVARRIQDTRSTSQDIRGGMVTNSNNVSMGLGTQPSIPNGYRRGGDSHRDDETNVLESTRINNVTSTYSLAAKNVVGNKDDFTGNAAGGGYMGEKKPSVAGLSNMTNQTAHKILNRAGAGGMNPSSSFKPFPGAPSPAPRENDPTALVGRYKLI